MLHLPTLRYRKYNPDGVWAHRVVWWRWVGADCMWVVDVVWADYVWDGWFRLGRLRVDVRPLRKIAPSRVHLLPSLCRDGTFIWRGKGGFHFYLYLCKQ